MSQEDRTVLVDNVKLDEGISQKTQKPYKRTVVSWKGEDGSTKFASAFGDSLFTPAKALEGDKAIITTQPNGNFTDLVAIRPAPKTAQEKVGTGEYVTGQKPPIEVRRMAALNAWNNAAQAADLELRYITGREVTPAMVEDTLRRYAGLIFHDLLIKGQGDRR